MATCSLVKAALGVPESTWLTAYLRSTLSELRISIYTFFHLSSTRIEIQKVMLFP